MSVDHLVHFVSFPFMIHLRYFCAERFILSTRPLVYGT